MKTIITSGTHNGKPYKICYVAGEYTSYYELSVYDRPSDSFIQKGGNFNSLTEAQSYLENL